MNALPAASAAPLSKAALDDFLNQAERFAFIIRLSAKMRRKIEVDINQRRAWLLDFLQIQQQMDGFTPNTLLQIQRLHRLWLQLEQPEAASAVISRWGETAVEGIIEQDDKDADWYDIGVMRTETRIWLLLEDSKSLWHFDRESGLNKLRQAAELIRTLPADLGAIEAMHPRYHGMQYHYSPDDYWQVWQECAENLYCDQQLAQQGLSWESEQNRH